MQSNPSQSSPMIISINVMELQPVEINAGKQMTVSVGIALLQLSSTVLTV